MEGTYYGGRGAGEGGTAGKGKPHILMGSADATHLTRALHLHAHHAAADAHPFPAACVLQL